MRGWSARITTRQFSRTTIVPYSRLKLATASFLIRAKAAHCLEVTNAVATEYGMAVLTTVELEYVVRGYHEYKRVWTPVVNEMLSTEIEGGNPHDGYAVAVISESLGTVGHVPRNISRLCHSFLSRNGIIEVRVLGRRKRSDLPQGGLDVPCMFIFTGKKKLVKRLQRALTEIKM